jgi:hypothetical protein
MSINNKYLELNWHMEPLVAYAISVMYCES